MFSVYPSLSFYYLSSIWFDFIYLISIFSLPRLFLLTWNSLFIDVILFGLFISFISGPIFCYLNVLWYYIFDSRFQPYTPLPLNLKLLFYSLHITWFIFFIYLHLILFFFYPYAIWCHIFDSHVHPSTPLPPHSSPASRTIWNCIAIGLFQHCWLYLLFTLRPTVYFISHLPSLLFLFPHVRDFPLFQ